MRRVEPALARGQSSGRVISATRQARAWLAGYGFICSRPERAQAEGVRSISDRAAPAGRARRLHHTPSALDETVTPASQAHACPAAATTRWGEKACLGPSRASTRLHAGATLRSLPWPACIAGNAIAKAIGSVSLIDDVASAAPRAGQMDEGAGLRPRWRRLSARCHVSIAVALACRHVEALEGLRHAFFPYRAVAAVGWAGSRLAGVTVSSRAAGVWRRRRARPGRVARSEIDRTPSARARSGRGQMNP